MNHVHMFRWNIPAENQFSERTDRYLEIIATWNTEHYYNDGSPMCWVELVNPTIHTCMQVKNWFIAEGQIRKIATEHFADLARKERINKARAELIAAGELDILLPAAIDNPVLERYQKAETNNAPFYEKDTTNLIDDLPY